MFGFAAAVAQSSAAPGPATQVSPPVVVVVIQSPSVDVAPPAPVDVAPPAPVDVDARLLDRPQPGRYPIPNP
ncbi:hypothetical protein [Saccharothrix hoggarensis]|uniref:Uncharacterized protein n=1 Tax=Saccharothrix hoggarensis TaxID=913853 RepID=A0ABW3QMM3_9PSEU